MLGQETAPGRVRQQPDLQVGVQVTTAPSSGLSRPSDASHDSSQRRESRPSGRDGHLEANTHSITPKSSPAYAVQGGRLQT